MILARCAIYRRALSCLAALLIVFGVRVSAQEKPQEVQVVPANVLLAEHSNWFTPAKIYDLKKEHYPLEKYPASLGYDIYSAVGYDLANTILIQGPNRDTNGHRELVIIDTLGNPDITHRTIRAFRTQGILPPCPEYELGDPVPPECRLPLRAIIFTHNHIDHTFGVWGYLTAADRPPCRPADPKTAGPDTYFDVDQENQDCIAVIGQYKINEGVGTTALITGAIIDARSSYMYGNFIPRNHVNSGIGPQELSAHVAVEGKKIPINGSYRMPSRTFNDELLVKAAGVEMKLIYLPSETNDELAVFLPDRRNTTGFKPEKDDWGGPGVLQSAEVIQGPSFPNLYSLRGTSYRDPTHWFRSVDKLRQFDSWCMVPSHGPPLCEPHNIQRLLKTFRDAIQFTHDQTMRWMNKGYTMNELAPLVEGLYLTAGEHDYLMENLGQVRPTKNAPVAANQCPEAGTPVVPPQQPVPPGQDCVNPRDCLRPFYGSVVQAVREIYVGSVGWFEADPVALWPTPPKLLAQRTIALMCGPDPAQKGGMVCGAEAVNLAAGDALKKGDYAWAAELATHVVRASVDVQAFDDLEKAKKHEICAAQQGKNPALQEASRMKAEAFLKLGEAEMNPNWRNWYITAAHALQCVPMPTDITGGLVAPGVIDALPAGAWVNSLTMRLRAEVTAQDKVEQSLGFWFPASSEKGDQGFGALGYLLNVRRGIAEFIAETPAGRKLYETDVAAANLAISIEKSALNALLLAEARSEELFKKAWDEAVKTGRIKALHGSLDDFKTSFLRYFEPKPTGIPPLAGR